MFTACGTMHRQCCRLVSLPAGNIVGALYYKLQTQFIDTEDGRNYRPKHVELIGIINKPLFLHPVGCLYYCINDARSYNHQISQVIRLIKLHILVQIFCLQNLVSISLF